MRYKIAHQLMDHHNIDKLLVALKLIIISIVTV